MRARDEEISTSGFYCVIINFYVECGGMLWLEHTTALNIVVNYYATKHGRRDLSITCAHIIYRRALSSLEDNLKMASRAETCSCLV